MVGKTKSFSLDRLSAIVEYFTSIEYESCRERELISHSMDFYSCINSLVREDLLKKLRHGGSVATSTASDDLVNIGFKCNFDRKFAEEVAKKIDFILEEYLFDEKNNDY
jgi:hypothetical protein